MKKKEFEPISRELLPALPDFVARAQLLFIPPIRHLIRGIYFARSIAARDFYVHIFVQPLFIPFEVIALSFGWRLRRISGNEGWNADQANLIPDLLDGLRREALPFLTRVRSPRDLANILPRIHSGKGVVLDPPVPFRSSDHIVQQAVAYSLARAGDVENAVSALDHLVTLLDPGFKPHVSMIDRAQKLKSQLMHNYVAAQQQLDDWENQTIAGVGLEGFWSRNEAT